MNHPISRPSLRTALASTLILGFAASSAAAQSLLGLHGEPVIAAGEAAPGLIGKTVFNTSSSGFGSPVIDQNGTILVQVRLLPSGTDDRVIYLGRGAGDLQVVAQSGTQAPGLPAGTLLQSNSSSSGSGLENDPIISPFGELVLFGSRIYDPVTPANTPTTADSALFWGPVNGAVPIAREGDQVPFLPTGVTYGSIGLSRQFDKINANGTVVFNNDVGGSATSADDATLITGGPGSLQLVAREGDPSGLPGGETWAAASGSTVSFLVAINDNDQIVFNPSLAGGSVTTANNSCLVVWDAGINTVWAREGDQAPGMAPGVVLFGSPATNSANWNNSNNMVFGWSVDDGGVTITPDNNQAVFFGGPAGFTKILQEGDATGLPGGETFGSFNNTSLKSNESGTLAFYCSLRDSMGGALPTDNDSAMVTGAPGNLTFIVREGEVIPEIPASVNGPWTCGNVTGSTNLNNRGQLLFNQTATDGVDSITFFLIYDPALGLQVARDQNEMYTTGVGTGMATASTSNAGTQGNSDGGSLWFNHSGDFAFRQGLDNGLQAAIIHGRSGSLIAKPALMSTAGGSTQDFVIDCGTAQAGRLYLVIGSQSGIRPGTPSPLGPQTIPLNLDSWLDVSLGFANSSIYGNTLGLLDANGRVAGGASFTLPAGGGALAGSTLHHCVAVLDFSLNSTFFSEPAAVKFN